jgi:hypothetical protein
LKLEFIWQTGKRVDCCDKKDYISIETGDYKYGNRKNELASQNLILHKRPNEKKIKCLIESTAEPRNAFLLPFS